MNPGHERGRLVSYQTRLPAHLIYFYYINYLFMKAPICEVCLKSKVLCKADEKKMKEGKISKFDVDVSREIYNISSRFQLLKDVVINHVYGSEKLVVILTRKEDVPKIIGRNGIVVKVLSKRIGKVVKVVPETKDLKEFTQSIVYPVPVLCVNILYEDGNKIYKVFFERTKFGIDKRSLKQILSNFIGGSVEIYKYE